MFLRHLRQQAERMYPLKVHPESRIADINDGQTDASPERIKLKQRKVPSPTPCSFFATGNLSDCIGQLPNLRYLFFAGLNVINESVLSLSSLFQNSTQTWREFRLLELGLRFQKVSGKIWSLLEREKAKRNRLERGQEASERKANACHEEEKEALISFKSHITDPSNRLSSWKGQNCCSWYGIRRSDSLHVTAIDLRNPNPDSLILDLNSQPVSTSDFPSTDLTGTIPSSLFSLTLIRKLKLSGVDLSEASRSTLWAKSISNLFMLRLLDLSNCGISGEVPVEQLFNLSRLSHLFMDFNFIASKIPSKLANLTSLSVLDLTRSNLQGHIPYLPQLKDLYVGSNSDRMVDLHSMLAVPWPQLESIDMSSTQVIGSIPPSIANITSLDDFIAYNSLIQGQIPASMMNLSSLEQLFLDMNSFTGEISPSISNLKSLHYLSLIQNSFKGSIPDTICSISSLHTLALAENSFIGNLPDCIGQLHDLSYLEVSFNMMNGTIPSLSLSFQNSTPYMVGLGFSGLTVLSGTIPSWLFNLPNLGYLDISFNSLQGVIPPNIKLKLFFIQTTLILRNNQLHGSIPRRIENIEALDLSILGISSNKLYGNIPSSVCQANSELMLLDLSNNNFAGTIPTSLGNCTSLIYLNLGGNNLSGVFQGNCKVRKS
ncbi:probable LRR receptor-like serine/threonine-protein kinase At4g36180 [Durio zibethinus]|uniref:Probable LRR receptor-like serine/threonine-protein kinase At4g36180 n=1 Tax=Durio zibethinus TaxID=66656 RepID=A0A6P6AM46_DURZI|nr:probable LRR receptor-like serine/threonine-protein kinase At4g36180 [Durio zibethinus]